MKREEAKKFMADILTGHHEICTHNHYADASKAIDIIYDELDIPNIKQKPSFTPPAQNQIISKDIIINGYQPIINKDKIYQNPPRSE